MTTVAAFTIATSTASRSIAAATSGRRSANSVAATASSLSRGGGATSGLAPRTPFLSSRPRISASASASSLASSIVSDTTAASASITERLKKSLTVEHTAYEVVTRDVVSEYGAYCTLFRHKKSGAELLSVSVDDDNKVFGITLRTPPEDSTGVPHILEHSVLCGSRKYKTKDPFVQLLQGSLQTFLNAFTYPDRTCYVVASQNLKDFYNLINVYADAVYHPRAVNDPYVHAQEGWHLELENKDDALTYKGVVYNEMKGVYSSPDSLLNRASMRSIFPDNTYGVDSGGDPKVIPELSFEQFAEFHSRFYHPSNSRIYFSGDDDVYARLELMDEYLDDFQALPEAKVKSQVAWQAKRFDEPLRQVEQYPIGDDQPETHMLTVNWLINDKPMTAFEELAMGVMDHLLMGTTSAILRKTLMESGLGDAVTGGGLSDELLQATYSVGMKGVQPEKTAEVERLIQETLETVARDGFEADDIASSLNTIEFQMREFNTGSFPKGLSLMLGSMSKWIYDDSPTEGLKFEGPLAQLKKELAESGSKIFQDMVTQYLVNNKHRTTVELKPSKTLESEILKDEEGRLAEIKSKLKDEELDEIIEKTHKLKSMQAAEDPPEARATIPSLELSDLKRETTEYPIEVSKNENDSGVTVVRHEMGSTSGIAYVNLAVDISRLSLDDIALLPLFTQLMTEAGAGDYDAVALSRRIGTHTGGVDVSLMTSAAHAEGADESMASGGENLVTKMIIQGKATTEKVDELFAIFQLILKDARLDSPAKTLELLRQTRSGMESRIQKAGHSIANTRMVARHRVGGYVDELTKGLSYLQSVKKLIKEAEEDWPSLLARLENIRNTILDPSTCRHGMILDITADQKVFEGIKSSVDSLLQQLPGDAKGAKLPDFYKETHPWVPEAKKRMANDLPLVDEGIVVATQVSYVGKSGMLYNEGERIPGSAAVVSRFLKTGYLWDRVRVMGYVAW
jgi:presequence protease